MKRILFVEDNLSIAAALQHALRTTYVIDHITQGKVALYKTDVQDYDLILLDLILPDMPGQAVCQQLRERGVATPIMVVSAEDTVLSKIALLDAGANDYIVKPFSLGEIKARIRNLLRPPVYTNEHPTIMYAGDLTLNSRSHLATRGDIQIHLRRKEYALLECLLIHKGTVVSRRALTHYAWNNNEENWTNTIDVHIKHLRDKIDRPFATPLIKTVHGIGYKLDAPPIKTANTAETAASAAI